MYLVMLYGQDGGTMTTVAHKDSSIADPSARIDEDLKRPELSKTIGSIAMARASR